MARTRRPTSTPQPGPWEPTREAILIPPIAAGIAYAIQPDGRCPARDYYEALHPSDQNKFFINFARMAQHNMVKNPEKFRRNLGNILCQVDERLVHVTIAEFKIHGRRILTYQRGRWWLLLCGFDKGAKLKVESGKAGTLACSHLATS